ncbi:retrovirus-related pol polyprotein from transposon TNT 1-94 [Tanacetum coccineum]
MPALEDVSIFDFSRDDEDDGAEADMNNLDTTIQVSPIPTTRIHKDHPLDQVIGDLQSTTQTRKMSKNLEEHGFEEPKKDERGIIIRNKARLVAQGYTQEEGIDYDEVFAPVARIEAIRLFLAYASFKDFMVYQIDVKSVFLYGKIEEEAFQIGKIDKTLFIKRHKGDILLVQVYVDDIIFGLTKKDLCNAFEKLMHKKFQMSSMVELTFFLGLQVKQKKDDIFISQDKYVKEILKKFGKPKRKDTQIPQSSDPSDNIANETVHKELGDSLVRPATTASNLEAKQDSGNITKTQSKAMPNESSSQGTNSGGGPRCQETMGDTIAQTRFENVSKHSNDSLLARGNTLQSDGDRRKIDELLALCTTLQIEFLIWERLRPLST